MADPINTPAPAPGNPPSTPAPAPATPVAQTPSQAPNKTPEGQKPNQTVQAPKLRGTITPPPHVQQFDDNGDPIPDALVPPAKPRYDDDVLPASTRDEMNAGKAAVDQHKRK